jgi:hypothetical protein
MPAFDADNHFFKPVESDNLSLGQNGATVETGTTAVTGSFFAIQCIADTVFSSLTGNYDGDTLAGSTLTSGTIIFGRFSAFTLTSGKVIAYKYADA